MMAWVILGAGVLYLAELLFLRAGLRRTRNAAPPPPAIRNLPRVSVIVAARNEEEVIGTCIDSLEQLDYPRDLLEIILVNDGSTDRTGEILRAFCAGTTHARTLSTTPGSGNLRGKANALEQGAAIATGEILLFTDADCTVPPAWVRRTVHAYDESAGMVGGFTYLEGSGTFSRIQALDWVFLFSLASAAAGWNLPLTAIGTNLSVRRSAYRAVGGYAGIPFSVTEDYALVQAVVQRTGLGLRFPVDRDAMVTSKPCKTWRQLFRQKQRWGVGGLDMIPRGYAVMAVGYTAKLLLLAGFLLGAGWPVLLSLALMILGEVAFLSSPLRRLGLLRLLAHYPAFACYLTAYVLALPFITFLARGVVWKERRL